jgi:hypothetical protein
MKISAVLPDELGAALEARAQAEDRSASSLVRLAVRNLLFANEGAILGRGWRLEEDCATGVRSGVLHIRAATVGT